MSSGLDVVDSSSSSKQNKMKKYTVGICRNFFTTHFNFFFAIHSSYPLFDKGMSIRFFTKEKAILKKRILGIRRFALLLTEPIVTSIWTLQSHRD